LVLVVAGYLVGAVGRNRLRQGLAPRPDEPAASGEGTSQGLFTPAATANERSGLGKVAFGLFLAGILLASLVFAVMVVTRPIKRAEMEKRVKAEIAATREATERKAEEARLASPSFGPVVESILKTEEVRPEGRVAELLDLDTGRRATSTNFGDNDRETHSWIRANQLDAIGVIEHGQIAVLCFDTVVMPAVSNDWATVTAQNLVTNWNLAQLEPNKITGISPMTDKTDTWLFRTREGGRGILQILGQSHDPLGVKVRYKLVQSPQPKP
jgi:hypothetical protein